MRLVVVLMLVLAVGAVFAQQPATPEKVTGVTAVGIDSGVGKSEPTLTLEEKKDIVIAMQGVKIAELELNQARITLQNLVTKVTPAGYQLNDKFELVKVEVKK